MDFRLLLGSAALALALTACATIPIAEEDLYDPRRSVNPEAFSAPGVSLSEISVPSAEEGLELSAWWLETEAARATILFFGGRDFHLVQSGGYLDLFADLGVNALLVDYRGYGRSDGEPSLQAALADAGRLHRYLTEERGISPWELIVHGHSIGSFPALAVADIRPVGGVVLENPVTSGDHWNRSLLPWYARIFVRPQFQGELEHRDNLRSITHVREPLLVVAGDRDRLVPDQMARELHRHAAGDYTELVLVEGGGHNDLHRFSAYREGYERLLGAVAEAGAGRNEPP